MLQVDKRKGEDWKSGLSSGGRSSDYEIKEAQMSKIRADRKNIFTSVTHANYANDEETEEERRLRRKQLRIAQQKGLKPKFHWENRNYTRSIEKFKELQLQKELEESESYSLASSHKGRLPTMKSFQGARATFQNVQEGIRQQKELMEY